LKRAVAAGAGIGFISRRAIETEIASGILAVVKVEGLSIIRHFYALHNKNPELPVVEFLWNYLATQADADISLQDKP
jgi:DNA-binding transcriptional LysR family regulator